MIHHLDNVQPIPQDLLAVLSTLNLNSNLSILIVCASIVTGWACPEGNTKTWNNRIRNFVL